MTHPIENSEAALRFILAGNSRFTIRSKATGTRFSFRVRAKLADDAEPGATPEIWFVNLLTGPDNEADYRYLGFIKPTDNVFRMSAKSCATPDAPSAKAFVFFWRHLIERCQIHDGIEVWHEGQCGRCGRALTVPESIASGLGPECAAKMEGF